MLTGDPPLYARPESRWSAINREQFVSEAGTRVGQIPSHSMRKRLVTIGIVGNHRCGCNAASWCDAHRPQWYAASAQGDGAGL